MACDMDVASEWLSFEAQLEHEVASSMANGVGHGCQCLYNDPHCSYIEKVVWPQMHMKKPRSIP